MWYKNGGQLKRLERYEPAVRLENLKLNVKKKKKKCLEAARKCIVLTR